MIVEENALSGAPSSEWSISGAGDLTNLGFAREFSVNVGETVNFSCHGAGIVIDVYRIGWYDGLGWRKIDTIPNVPTTQPTPDVIPNSNGGITCGNWSTTASWEVPAGAVSGLFVGVFRNATETGASWIPFVVRDDAREVDIIIKTSDTTWALAYNKFNGMGDPLHGPSLYGRNELWDTPNRTHAVSYHRPIITRGELPQTYWLACEAPLIRFAERNGMNVKYVSSKDLDQNPGILNAGKIMISSGHDEYWSTPMRESAETYRDQGGHMLFMTANEVFWRTRFDSSGDTMWCYKDTMIGPGAHVGGEPLDPVTWTGTWKDTRWEGHKPENTLTGTDFRMNGIYDHNVQFSNASHPVWRHTPLIDGVYTEMMGVIGFEADRMAPTQPSESVRTLASHTVNINGAFADDNGEHYEGNGDLTWGIVSQRYASGALVVGFGTCQWAWALDATHDRGGNYEHLTAQQFTINMLADLGAIAPTLRAGLTSPDPVMLDEYGAVPASTTPPVAHGQILMADGTPVIMHIMQGGQLVEIQAGS